MYDFVLFMSYAEQFTSKEELRKTLAGIAKQLPPLPPVVLVMHAEPPKPPD